MKQKSIKNIRQEFKDNGIFYTPPELAEKLKSYVDFEREYDGSKTNVCDNNQISLFDVGMKQ